MSAIIEVNDLGRKYGDSWGLKSADFSVKKGELAVLVGPNGAGKTTTVKILTTFLKPSKGSAKVYGMDTVKECKQIRNRISFLPQEYDVSNDLTPMEAVMWHLVARGFPVKEARERTKRWLELLGIWDLRRRTCWTLSGGEKRRTTIATALASEPELVFLDEPTVGLDVEIKHSVWKALRELVFKGTSILLTTHDMNEAQNVSDKAIMMSGGKTVAQEEPSKLVKSLPYRYRVVAEKSERIDYASFNQTIDLGDRLIVYAKSRDEAVELVDELSPIAKIYAMNEVGLEDAYLHVIKKEGAVAAKDV